MTDFLYFNIYINQKTNEKRKKNRFVFVLHEISIPLYNLLHKYECLYTFTCRYNIHC